MLFNERFKADYYRMTGRKFRYSLVLLRDYLFRHNVRFMFWFRAREAGCRVISKYMLYKCSRKYGLEVSPTAKIGQGCALFHPYNISIGDGVVLGENVNLHKGATVGVENRGKRMGAPTIGNCVFIGINATVCGKITIGNDVLISPGAFVNFDVPSHSVVIGNPGVIHPCENATALYIRNIVT